MEGFAVKFSRFLCGTTNIELIHRPGPMFGHVFAERVRQIPTLWSDGALTARGWYEYRIDWNEDRARRSRVRLVRIGLLR
jgi:hypothetical protein